MTDPGTPVPPPDGEPDGPGDSPGTSGGVDVPEGLKGAPAPFLAHGEPSWMATETGKALFDASEAAANKHLDDTSHDGAAWSGLGWQCIDCDTSHGLGGDDA